VGDLRTLYGLGRLGEVEDGDEEGRKEGKG
jgi:hypothetical protein